jgi:predicted transposase/invertase (TIGR01784 family)
MLLGIDPKNDYAFKRLFGHPHELPLLFSLLDAVLQPEHRLAGLDLLNPFNDKDSLDDKLSILDVKARDHAGRQFNIEMQLLAPAPFRARVLYYWARFYQSQLAEGDSFQILRPTISICLVNTPLFPQCPDHHLVFHLREERHNLRFNDHLETHILELTKFTKTPSELASPLDRWLYFLRHAERLDSAALDPRLDFPEIHRAMEVLTKMNHNVAERERYEARQKHLHDVATWQQQILLANQEKEQAIRSHLVGRVHLCERVLGRPLTAAAQLALLPSDELLRLAEKLEAQVIQSLPPNP